MTGKGGEGGLTKKQSSLAKNKCFCGKVKYRKHFTKSMQKTV